MRKIFAVMMSAVLASCGGGGGNDPEPPLPALPSGQVDAGYGTSGRIQIGGLGGDIAVAPDGSLYFAANSLLKFDASGRPVESFGAAAPEFLVGGRALLAADGSVFFIRGAAIAKVDSA